MAMKMSQARAARVAGALYVIQMATGVFGFAVRSSLSVRGDVSQTAENILAAERLFRVSIVTDMVTFAAVAILSWALYVLLKPFHKDVALLALLLRTVELGILGATTTGLLVGLTWLRGAAYQQIFDAPQLHALARVAISISGQGHSLAFIFLGLGSATFAYLLLKSGYVPRIISAWGIGASVLLALGSCATVIFPEFGQTMQMASMAPMGIYEVGLGVWLLVRGARLDAAR